MSSTGDVRSAHRLLGGWNVHLKSFPDVVPTHDDEPRAVT